MLRLLLNIWQSLEQSSREISSQRTIPSSHSPKNSRHNAHEAVESALRELERSIQGLENALSTAEQDKQNIATTLHNYQQRSQTLHSEAKMAIQARNEAAAREILLEQQGVESMVQAYERMLRNIAATVRKVQDQHRAMLVQRDEIRARQTIIEAELSSAQSHEEFIKNLHSLGVSHERLEEELLHTTIRTGLAGSETTAITDDYLLANALQQASVRANAEASAEDILATLNAELETERLAKSRLEADALQKRFSLAFHGQQKTLPNLAAQAPLPLVPSPEKALADFFTTANTETQNVTTSSQAISQPSKEAVSKEIISKEDHLKNFFNR